jgi:hypothetical protein
MKITKILLIGFGILCLWLLFWPSEKDHLNAQMAELCKKDGGVKIYEKVKLPLEMFSSGGVLKESNYRKLNDHESVTQLADIYELHLYITKIKKGDPFKGEGNLERDYTKIVRITDKKLIAESVFYSRGGGDRWFAGMPSSTVCPENDETKWFEKKH